MSKNKHPGHKPRKAKKFKKKTNQELHPRVIISGYYGFDNLGDELILQVLVDELKAQDVKITVLSNQPRKTAMQYDVDAIHRLNVIDIIDALAQANLFISGGGGLFQDASGPMSPLYYGGLIQLAHFFEVPVCFWAQGVGPLNRNFSRKITAAALEKCAMVTVRDEASATLVEDLTGTYPEITADPVWLLNAAKKKTASASNAKKHRPKGEASDKDKGAWRIGISLRTWPDLTPTRLQVLADCLKALVEGAKQPVEFVLLPCQKNEDVELLKTFSQMLMPLENARCVMSEPNQVIEKIGECDLLFGMRFHSLILGILQNVAVYGLPYDPKVANLLGMLNLQGMPVNQLESISAAAVQDYFNHYPAIDLKTLKKHSKRNFDILNRLLEIPDAELVL